MSQTYVVNGVGTVLSYATQKQDELMKQRISQAYGMASKYGYILPYSRKHESEADQMGIILMAQAVMTRAKRPYFGSDLPNHTQVNRRPSSCRHILRTIGGRRNYGIFYRKRWKSMPSPRTRWGKERILPSPLPQFLGDQLLW